MIKQNFMRFFLLFALLALTVGCNAQESSSPQASEASGAEAELTPLRVTAFPYLSFAPLYIADAEGFFAKQGLKVEFVRFQGNAESLPALLQGEVDVDSIFTVGLLNAIGRGEAARVVANKGMLMQNDCPADGFLVGTELAGQLSEMSPSELGELTFGVDPTWLDSYLLQQWLAERDMNLSDVQTEYLPDPAARAEALRQGTLDMAFLSEPWITRAQESEAGVLEIPAAEIIPGYSLGVLTFGPSLLEGDDETGVRFMRAYLEGIAQYMEGKTARNIEILSEVTQLEPDLLERICWPTFPADGQIDAQAISDYSSWTVTQGLTDKALTPEEFWEPRFLITAKETLND